MGKSPGVAKNMFILSGVSEGRLDEDIVMAGEKKILSLVSLLLQHPRSAISQLSQLSDIPFLRSAPSHLHQ